MIEDMAVYIANLGKYNEGYLVGDWFRFPLNEEEIAERIGLNAEYEEYAVHDTDNFPMEVSEYISIEELNNIYDMIEDFPDYIVDCLDEFISHYGSLEEFLLACKERKPAYDREKGRLRAGNEEITYKKYENMTQYI